ncbi:MAG: hypothetical protein R6V05_09650 [Candidatus Brocadiia bacterium]
MAAVRRSSQSGVVVALVVFVILAFAGVGCGIWFYQQLQIAKQAIAQSQSALDESVHAVFRDSNWELPTQSPDQLGIRYTQETFQRVAQQLRVAAAFQNEIAPTLGWTNLQNIQDEMESSPLQQELQAEGQAGFDQLSGLFDAYERRYEALSTEVSNLSSQNEDLSGRLAQAKQDLVETEKNLGEKVNQEIQDFRDQMAELRADYEDLLASYNQQQETAQEWQQKFQEQVNDRKAQVAQLQDQVGQWENRYWEAVQGPGEAEELPARGEVISVDSDNDFVFIEGGSQHGFHENEVYVVFSRTPDGQNVRKGEVVVGDVYENVSRAIIRDTVQGEYILQGDEFTSLELWDKFEGS